MNRKRTPRNDSTAARHEALRGAGTVIKPPSHVRLRDGDLPFWNAVIRARASQLWTSADLIYAGILMRAMADIVRLQVEVHNEGDTLTSARGSTVTNPKFFLIDTLTRRSMALSRMLQITPRGQSTNARRDAELAKRAEEEADDALGDLDDHDHLIPRFRQ